MYLSLDVSSLLRESRERFGWALLLITCYLKVPCNLTLGSCYFWKAEVDFGGGKHKFTANRFHLTFSFPLYSPPITVKIASGGFYEGVLL